MKKSIPILDLKREYRLMRKDIDQAIRRALSQQRWVLGPLVEEFEQAAGRYLKAKYACGLNSGTDALVIALRSVAQVRLGRSHFRRQDEIITTPFTFVATAEAILRTGARPVFVDINPETFNIDPLKISKAINKNTVGILPVHLYGRPCDMAAIAEIAKKKGLFVVEDCAQSFGSCFKSKSTGTLSDAGCFSFFPSKNLGGFGDGGLVASSDKAIIEQAKILRNHGGRSKYDVAYLGYNSRLDALQAVILRAKLKYIDQVKEKRQALADYYRQHLKDLDYIILPPPPDRTYGIFWNQFTLRIKGGRRDKFAAGLKQQGIGTMIYYPLTLEKMQLFKTRCSLPYPIPQAHQVCGEVISLPLEPFFTPQELKAIVTAIRKFKP